MTIEQIKEQCRQSIELAEKATAPPWMRCGCSVVLAPERPYWELMQNRIDETSNAVADADHIAHARTFAPAAARALLKAIEQVEEAWDSVGRMEYDEKCDCPSCEMKRWMDDICEQFEQ